MNADRQSERKIATLTSVLLLIGFVTGGLFLATSASSQEATDAAVSRDDIEENIRSRLEQAIQDGADVAHLKRAWVGSLESIANHTLTIETRDGPKLASVSAETQFVRLPSRNTLKIGDLEIGSHTIAMGNINGNKVLEALRVLVYDEPPEELRREVFFALELEFDPQDDSLSFVTADGESWRAEVTSTTTVTQLEGSEIIEVEREKIDQTDRAILIQLTEEDDDEVTVTILRVHLLTPSPMASPDEAPGGQVTTESSPGAADY